MPTSRGRAGLPARPISSAAVFTTRPELRGRFGMVATTHWLASTAGMAVLEQGGNAFDAAVAAGFTLQVVEPHLNGPGGEVPALFYAVERGEPLTLCGQGVAPAAATIERFRDLGYDLVPGTGVLAACVPGAFGGWLLLLQEFGTWSLADVLAFANAPIPYSETFRGAVLPSPAALAALLQLMDPQPGLDIGIVGGAAGYPAALLAIAAEGALRAFSVGPATRPIIAVERDTPASLACGR